VTSDNIAQERLPSLQRCLDAVHQAIAARAPEPAIAVCSAGVFQALAQVAPRDDAPGRRLSPCNYWNAALDHARAARQDLAPLADALQALEPALRWYTRPGDGSASANFAQSHANAMLVGPSGLERRSDVWVGISLLAPLVRYPDHSHPPQECYLLLSPGQFRQGDAPWFEPGTGGMLFNPPGIQHAMRSGPQPLLAVWCLDARMD
jgi:hypothetical protein